MCRAIRFTLFVVLLCSVRPVWSADLGKIARTIVKQPAYKGQPKYCLLVFGAEAKNRVWLVVDDESAYLDRNGNGDLTENGERLIRMRNRSSSLQAKVEFPDEKTNYAVTLVLGYNLIEVQGKLMQKAKLSYAENAADAPILHFDGPMSIDVHDSCSGKPQSLIRGNNPGYLMVSIGTPGHGPGTFVSYMLPKTFTYKPLAQIEFTHRDEKEKPIRVEAILTRVDTECSNFEGSVRVPEAATGALAKVTLSVPEWKEGGVTSRTITMPITEAKPLFKGGQPPR